MTRFDPAYPIERANPAAYNPRRIDEAGIDALRDSLRSLGVIRPIVVTEAGTLLAGHQRTKAMALEGIATAPAYVLGDLPVTEEIRFNQLHNASDFEICDSPMHVPPHLHGGGFVQFDPSEVTGDYTGGNAAKLQELCRLLTMHGPFGGFVATASGRILVGAIYAHACRLVGVPALCCYVPDFAAKRVREAFGRQYGVYSYAHLPKTTWAQSNAQMNRLRSEATGKSRTYEKQVMRQLKPGMRVLDFGAGKMDYVKKLRKEGVDIRGLEFFFRRGGKLDPGQVHRDIDALCRDLKERGRYDLVVCDSVLNSVDSDQAESDVLLCLSAFCKPGCIVIFSGRSREFVDYIESNLSSVGDSQRRYVGFLDDGGYSAMFADGVWRYQKFHSVDQVMKLARFHGCGVAFNSEGRLLPKARPTSGWCVVALNTNAKPEAEITSALAREFDLALPSGKRYGRGVDILEAYTASCKR